jgi:hypothetical protein
MLAAEVRTKSAIQGHAPSKGKDVGRDAQTPNADFEKAEVIHFPDLRPKTERESEAPHDHMEPTMSDTPPRSEISAYLEAVEARTDAKIAGILGEVRVGFATLNGTIGKLEEKVDGVKDSTSGLKTTVIVTGIAAVALVVTVLAYGQTWFGIGVTTRDVVKSAVTEYIQQLPKK